MSGCLYPCSTHFLNLFFLQMQTPSLVLRDTEYGMWYIGTRFYSKDWISQVLVLPFKVSQESPYRRRPALQTSLLRGCSHHQHYVVMARSKQQSSPLFSCSLQENRLRIWILQTKWMCPLYLRMNLPNRRSQKDYSLILIILLMTLDGKYFLFSLITSTLA